MFRMTTVGPNISAVWLSALRTVFVYSKKALSF